MTAEDLIKELERYRDELTKIMKRFIRTEGIHPSITMNREDDPRFRTIVLDLIGLLNDSIPGNSYSTMIQNTYDSGYRAFFSQFSYKCVENIVATLDSVITRIKRNPELCKPKKDVQLVNKPLEYPDKITMKWLWHNVPYSFWGWLISALLTAFLTGVFVGQTKLYHDITTTNADSPNLINNTTQAPTATENNTDRTAAPIKNDTLRK